MNQTVQSGTHPDAQLLTAFAEQSLSTAERDQIFAHLSMCGRCREIVFLAQHAAEEPEAVRVPAAAQQEPRGAWLKSLRWAWIPAAALAGFIGVAVVQHFRHQGDAAQMAVNTSPAVALPKAGPAKAPPANINGSLKSEEAQSVRPSAMRDRPLPPDQKDESKQLDLKKSANRKELAVGSGASPIVLSPGVSGGSFHGMIAARAKASPYGGPAAANQFQQNLSQQDLERQSLDQQDTLQKSQNAAVEAANKPVVASAPQGSSSQTVTVQAETAEMAPAPSPAATPQPSTISRTGQDFATLSAAIAGKDKAQKITLPNGVGVLSVASEAGRSIALDTAGVLFLSEDDGKHWKPIQPQWTGRAVLVRARPVGTQAAALSAPQTMRFELVNDKLQTWASYDGNIWISETPAGK